ncbi:plasmid pRiA4b ORF-3 family protein [Bacillus marinisedimentorum]|uniref:plasmid pRiA4b ORF-3 family protein n=1 Tax=Bacillus marinisedimentorum TaxID=1821260 RepID=UPI0007DFD43B|nr:plasmid pRiA4b ORF-3 family protein [Bacillus marinisedimentorum]
MLIQCTKKLLDKLKRKPETESEETNPVFSWHANLLTQNRRNTVVLVNDSNRYVIVLHGLKAKDFQKIDQLIVQAIRETFQAEGIREELIEQYIQDAGEIRFTKTKDRTSVARMNSSCEPVYYHDELFDETSIVQTAMSKRASRNLVGAGKKNSYIEGYEELYKDLETLYGAPIFNMKAAELKVSLLLDNHEVWRKLIVPVNVTFSELHDVIQAAFDWKDSHLHEFLIYHSDDQPPLSLVVNERFIANSVGEAELEEEERLADHLNAKIEYIYDFGDSWEHEIEVGNIKEDYDKNYPVCLEGKGNTPPEDVGGEPGYDSFLEIIADETHPDYQHTYHWGKLQGYKEFELEKVNRRLKHL